MGLVELKGKANYTCPGYTWEETGELMNCEDAAFNYEEQHKEVGGCGGYKPAKEAFVNSPLGVTNFAYYLSETAHASQLKPRTMLILDEAHNTEQHILSLASIEITRYRCEEASLDFSSVPFITPDAVGIGEALDWLNQTFRPAATEAIQRLSFNAEERRDMGMQKEASKLKRRASGMERFIGQLDLFLKSENRKDWMVWSESEIERCPQCCVKQKYSGKKECWKCHSRLPLTPAKMIIKPLTATLFAEPALFSKADKVIMLSATILDFNTFLRNLGINRNDAVCVAVPSEFPVCNRPIYYRPVGNMNYGNIEATLPKMAEEVGRIMRKYPNNKGIVHCVSFRVTNYLIKYLTEGGLGGRILTHSGEDTGSMERVVEEHIASSSPSVLFSPSLSEGLDLKEDLSRFQVIVKIPYKALDVYVKARMALDMDWYNLQAAISLVQATGRSVRSMTDRADTYILDSGFESFIKRAGHMLPEWWVEAVKFPGEYTIDW
jgi:Rad3-related DNA helicase